ncbi:hypothetical protein CVT24_007532 [Panaeolus cyanescens]|uniref:MoaB/Mog domain-containing protein n=1 Tax=Panaeolus cyanescens TaxID=181874 RepID=A0A409W5K4_9AGAR|nr:hypothetical protein CVT24_007532 [Panaeolus cyanescens]
MPSTLRVAILTGKYQSESLVLVFTPFLFEVSDTASSDASTDKSGPAIRDILKSKSKIDVLPDNCKIAADDVGQIRAAVQQWAGSGQVDWIITTGGTGFGTRDVTPEAITPLITKPAPGLVHLMISSSLQKTPLAALSRPVAGSIGNALVTTLPGSPKAVKENLEALFQGGVVEHAIELLRGGSGSGVHAKLQGADSRDAGRSQTHGSGHHHHHHHHHHGHDHHAPTPRSKPALSHDPTAPASARHRHSPYAQISLEEALSILKNKTTALPTQTLPVDARLAGYILAEDVYAPRNVPPTPTTSLDGYALRSTDPPGIYKVLTSQTHPIGTVLPEGHIYRINTGGPLPAGTDTVIMVEDTRLVSVYEEGDVAGLLKEEKEVDTLVQVPPGENVRKAGSDVKEGELVMRKGDRISRGGGEIGTLAFVGRKEVLVYKKPKVALLSTGNELVDLQKEVTSKVSDNTWSGIFDTNRPSLQAALERLGYEVLDLGIVPDDIVSHVEALKRGLQEADLILTTGGTSMGPTDLLKPVIERYLNGTVHFGRVSIKPGKPTTFATIPISQEGASGTLLEKPIFALPGNPASALVTFYVFVVPALRKLGGFPERLCELPRVMVQVQNEMPLDPRVEFHRVVIRSSLGAYQQPLYHSEQTGTEFALKAYSTGGQRSSRAASLCEANGFVILPTLTARDKAQEAQQGETRMSLQRGDYAQALIIGELEVEGH